MSIMLLYKIAQVIETPTADDSIPGDLPDAPREISFTPASKKLPVKEIINNMLSYSKNVPVIERGFVETIS
ncbi:MAG: hypothetical protein ABIM30_00600 [candidate division WOR-3 bacterium]